MVYTCKDSNAMKGKDAQEQKPTVDQTSHFNKRAEPLLLYERKKENRAVPPYTNLALVMSEAIAHGAILPHVCSRIASRNADMYAGAASPFDGPLKPTVKVWPIEGGDSEAVATNDERGTDLKQQGLDAEACFMKRTLGHAKAGCTREMSCEHGLLTSPLVDIAFGPNKICPFAAFSAARRT
jgi:hypothetical protein